MTDQLSSRVTRGEISAFFDQLRGIAHGGVSGLISRAGQLRQSTGTATAQCVAAGAAEVINRGAGGRKLLGWWRNG